MRWDTTPVTVTLYGRGETYNHEPFKSRAFSRGQRGGADELLWSEGGGTASGRQDSDPTTATNGTQPAWPSGGGSLPEPPDRRPTRPAPWAQPEPGWTSPPDLWAHRWVFTVICHTAKKTHTQPFPVSIGREDARHKKLGSWIQI